MLTNRPAVLIALGAGLLAAGVAFISDAGTKERSSADAPMRVATAVFAGGDFRSVEADFDKLQGIVETIPGYIGGTEDDPSHKSVVSGQTGHYEAVKVTYDPARVSYDELARYFVRTIDPTDDAGQFCDRGVAYRSAIFVSGQSERDAAVATLSGAHRLLGKEVTTEIRPLTTFWPADEQFQDYHVKNASRFASQRADCGRDERVQLLWGKAVPAL